MDLSVLKQAIVDDDFETFTHIVQRNVGILRCTKGSIEDKQSSGDGGGDGDGDTVLHLATRHGRIRFVAEILRLCPDMAGDENSKGETPFHEACRLGHDQILVKLLEKDPWSASTLNLEDQSAMYLACCYGHLKAVCIFLNQPWLQERDDHSFLHVAAAEGHTAIVGKILKRFPGVTWKQDKDGNSPLHHACSGRRPEITAMLLRHDPSQAFRFNKTGLAPIHSAAMFGSIEVLKELLTLAPECFQLMTKEGETVFHLVVKFEINLDGFLYLKEALKNTTLLNQPDKNGDTCLHLAISLGCYKIAEHIIPDGGEQINCNNFMGETPMNLIERIGDASSRHLLKEMLQEALGAKRSNDESASSGNVGAAAAVPHQQPTLEEPLLENSGNDEQLKKWLNELQDVQDDPHSGEGSQSFPTPEPTSPPIPDLAITENQNQNQNRERTRRQKRQMHQHKLQSEKSRKSLIQMYNSKKHHMRHQVYREALHNARETITIVAVLIATITYTGGLNPPGGVYQDGPLIGTAIAARRTSFKVFSICNNVALFASLSIVMVLVSIIPFRRKPLMMMLMVAHKAMWVAIGFMATAYSAASFVLMPPTPRGRQSVNWTFVSLLSISAGTLGSVFVVLGIMLTRHHWNKISYRKKVTDWAHAGKVGKDSNDVIGKVEVGKDPNDGSGKLGKDSNDGSKDSNHIPIPKFGDWDEYSFNSDLNLSGILGYHAY